MHITSLFWRKTTFTSSTFSMLIVTICGPSPSSSPYFPFLFWISLSCLLSSNSIYLLSIHSPFSFDPIIVSSTFFCHFCSPVFFSLTYFYGFFPFITSCWWDVDHVFLLYLCIAEYLEVNTPYVIVQITSYYLPLTAVEGPLWLLHPFMFNDNMNISTL